MTERPTHSDKRVTIADHPTTLASELREWTQGRVHLGNAHADCRPPAQLSCPIDVGEKQRLLGGNRERVTAELNWKPA